MTEMSSRIAAASGDAGALLALAIELAQEVARLKAIETADQERKAKQAARVRRHRNVTQRDVTLQGVTVTEGNTPPSPPVGKERVVIGSPPSPRRAPRPRPPAEPWVTEGVALWQDIVGDVRPGEFGGAMKPMVDRHGWPAVRPDLAKWLRERVALGKPCKPAWYAGEVTARLAAKPKMRNDDGTLTDYGERMSRPDKVPA